MTENQRLIQLIILRRRAMLTVFVVCILLGLIILAALAGYVPLPPDIARPIFVAFSVSALTTLVFTGMLLFVVRSPVWGIAFALLGLVALMGKIFFVPAVIVIIANRMAEQRLKALQAAEAEKVAAAARAAEEEDSESSQA
ncbi:MAG: hypothetical protein LAT61_03525 [Alcanivorax sp.]|nr:hypothetical protein [Alcanivorax sp.]